MPKGRNPQPPHFKKFTPIGLLAACIIGSGLLLTTTVQAEEECTINLKDNTHTCQNIAAIQQRSLESNQAVFKIDFNPALYAHTKAIFEIHYDLDQPPTGFTVNIGDSESNNGGGADGADQSHDSEMQVENQSLSIFGDDRLGGERFNKQPPAPFFEKNFLKQGDTVTLTVSNEHLEWASTSGTSGKLDSPYLYALAGQLPFDPYTGHLEGSVNYDIYAAFNRVINGTYRSGTGVSWVKIKLVQEQKVVLYTTSAKDIRVVPLVRGGMPDLTKGVDLVASAPCEDDLTQPAELVPLSAGKFIAIWRNQEDSCYSRFTPDNNGSFTENYMGQWLGGDKWDDGATGESNRWTPIPKSADLNGDSIDDLVLIHGTGAGDAKSYQYKVAFGQEDGSFDFTGKISKKVITNKRGAYFNLEDADRDGYVDLVFHSFDYGGPFTTTLYMLKGQKEGSFAATPQQLLTGLNGQGSTTPVFGNFNADDYLDVFLPPDDDVSNPGQTYIAFGKNPGLGTFDEVEKSIDLSDSGFPHDDFLATANACDINLDGHLDIISNEESNGRKLKTVKVYTGQGQGQFSTPGTQLFQTPVGQPHPTLTCGMVSWGPEPCVVAYVVHDGGLNDSLLLSVSNSNPNLKFTPIGTVHKGYDLEALALHPQTHVLYASSGENAGKRGYLYKVEGENVVELGQPGAFAGGLEGLSFNPNTNILWGWAQGTGLVKFDRIEPNPSASVILSYGGEIQDLTWSPQGDVLYAVENIPQGGKNKVVLWAYHPADGQVVAQCEKELEGWQEVEALQALPNGNLLFGLHNSKKLLTGTIDPNHGCQLGEIKEIEVPYDDIEGIALTACPLTM